MLIRLCKPRHADQFNSWHRDISPEHDPDCVPPWRTVQANFNGVVLTNDQTQFHLPKPARNSASAHGEDPNQVPPTISPAMDTRVQPRHRIPPHAGLRVPWDPETRRPGFRLPGSSPRNDGFRGIPPSWRPPGLKLPPRFGMSCAAGATRQPWLSPGGTPNDGPPAAELRISCEALPRSRLPRHGPPPPIKVPPKPMP